MNYIATIFVVFCGGCQPFDQRVVLFLVLLVVLEELGSSRDRPEVEPEVELAQPEVAAAMAPETEVTVGFIPKLAIPVASNVL